MAAAEGRLFVARQRLDAALLAAPNAEADLPASSVPAVCPSPAAVNPEVEEGTRAVQEAQQELARARQPASAAKLPRRRNNWPTPRTPC